ncbi:MAG: gamma-glutamylcyclotransferase [Deltaproteobacteria bacterium]|nr:MAG: gamma-glutamylcyclotransferase [Deltaproteobacteria bacterium]
MHYFAYGSNMALARLRQRIPSARRIGVAWLRGHRLAFRVASTRDGSAKCDACPTGDGELLWGVLYRVEPADKPILDRYEGTGVEYRDALLEVELEGCDGIEALIYLGTNLDPDLRPYPWYVEHVVRGAEENHLPADYIAAIRAVPTIPDPDPQRALRELSIYAEDGSSTSLCSYEPQLRPNR